MRLSFMAFDVPFFGRKHVQNTQAGKRNGVFSVLFSLLDRTIVRQVRSFVVKTEKRNTTGVQNIVYFIIMGIVWAAANPVFSVDDSPDRHICR
jgi:hypothetical protein